MDDKPTAPTTLLDILRDYQIYRINYEPKWYLAQHAYENEHFVAWSRSQGTLVKMPFRKRLFHQLPEVTKQADGMENLILQSEPVYTAYPNDYSDKNSIKEARYYSMLLRDYYLKWFMQNLLHTYVHDAIVMPVSFFEVGAGYVYDPDKKKEMLDVVGRTYDAFDILFNPRMPFHENRIIFKVIRTTKGDIAKNKLYSRRPGDAQTEMSMDFKEMWLQDKFGRSLGVGDQTPQILYEAHIRHNDGLQIKTIDDGGNVYRDDFYEGITFFSIVPLQLFSGSPYQPSFVERELPNNRSMDIIANRVEDFIYKLVKGSILKREGTELYFDDENGSIISYEGEKPDFQTIPVIPPFVYQWFSNQLGMSDRYGTAATTLAMPQKGSQNRSAKQIEKVAQQQVGQQKTPLDNFFYSLKQIADLTIFYLSEVVTEPRMFTFEKEGGQFQSVSFIGEKNSPLYPDSIAIPKKIKRLHVEIDDSLGYTIAGKREAAMELAKIFNSVPKPLQEILLDLYKVGNTADIMAAIEQNQTLLDNPEFQNLIANAQNLPPDVRQGLGKLLRYLSQQSPVGAPSQYGAKLNAGGTPPPVGQAGGGVPTQPPAQPADTGDQGGADNADQ